MSRSWLTLVLVITTLFAGCTKQTPSNSPDSFVAASSTDTTAPMAGLLADDNFKTQVETTPSSQPLTIYAGSDRVSVIGSGSDADGGIKHVTLFSSLTAYADVGINLSVPTVLGVIPAVEAQNNSSAAIGDLTLKSRPLAKTFDLAQLLGTHSRIKLDVWIEGENFAGATVKTARVSILYPARQQGDTAYMTSCRRHNVPVPPDWEESTTAWQLQGDLGQGTNLLAKTPGENAFVWTYSGPVRGGCIALPRQGGLAGIICQGALTGYACFWDNKLRSDGPTAGSIGWQGKRLTISDLQDGNVLQENCTECHRGNNVFLMSPDDGTWAKLLRGPLVSTQGSTFTTRVERSSDVREGHPRYVPLSSQPDWTNDFRPAAGRSCAQCHEMPDLSFGPGNTSGTFPPMPPACASGNTSPENCYAG